jgi:hypothetical protein
MAALLVLASFALASYQDIRRREVDDVIWLPGLIGLGLLLFLSPLPLRLPMAIALGLAGYLVVRLGAMGEADGIALFLWSSLGGLMGIIIAAAGALLGLLVHMALLRAWGRKRVGTMSLERALREGHWLPRRILIEGEWRELPKNVNRLWEELRRYDPRSEVEVEFGVPMVAYLGLGYLLAYLAGVLYGWA